jgi:hypothetical protein
MSRSKVRRCHITCRFESVEVLKSVTTCGQFIASNGKPFAIHSMTAAYNMNTKDTRIYAELERMGGNVVEDNMRKMGAGSFDIDTFSKDKWEADSARALKSVIECGEGPGYTLIRYGREPLAGNQAELGVSGEGEASDDDDDHEPHTRPSGLDGGKSKGGSGAQAGCGSARKTSEASDEEEESMPCSRPTGGQSDRERGKRRRTGGEGGEIMISFDTMFDKITTTMSSVVASSIASSGSVCKAERDNSMRLVQVEQERREDAENQLRKLQDEFRQKVSDERREFENEAVVRQRGLEDEIKKLREEKVICFFLLCVEYFLSICFLCVIYIFHCRTRKSRWLSILCLKKRRSTTPR